MKTIMRIALMSVFLATGFAIGFPVGQSKGFSTGSEWSLVQADIIAREAGLFMPVNLKDGTFRILMKQPKHLYKRAWVLADRHEDELAFLNRGDGTLQERIPLLRKASLLQ